MFNILGAGFRVPYGNVEEIANLAMSVIMLGFCLFGGIALFSKIYQEVRSVKKDRMTIDYGCLLLSFSEEVEAACQVGTIQDIWKSMEKVERILNEQRKTSWFENALPLFPSKCRVQTLRDKLPNLGINDSVAMNHEAEFGKFFANVIAPFIGLDINEHKGFVNINRLPERVVDQIYKLCQHCKTHIKDRRIRREQTVDGYSANTNSSDDEFSIDQMVGRKPRRIKIKFPRKKKAKKNSR